MARPKKDKSNQNNAFQIVINDNDVTESTSTDSTDKPIIIESLNPQSFSWHVAYVEEMLDAGAIELDILIQRGSVWNHKKDSLLIISLLTLTPIQNCYMNKVDDVYGVIDGKQRLTAIYRFIKNKYKLHASVPPIKINGKVFKMAGYNFENLPRELQTRIRNYSIRGDWFDNLPPEKEIEFFVLTNSGKPVSAAEISRSRIKSKKVFATLAEQKVMMLAINESNKRKRKDIDILSQLWCICFGGASSLLQKEIGPILSGTEVTEEQKNEIIKVLNYALEYYKTIQADRKRLTKMQKPTHVLSLFCMAFFAKQEDMDVEEFVDKAKAMFNGVGYAVTDNERYNESVKTGSSKSEQISIRIDELKKALL